MLIKICIALVAATVAFVIGVRMIAHRAPQPDRLGVVGGKLLPCPETPNCVSSYEGAPPFDFDTDRISARAALDRTLETWPRTKVIRSTDDYLHVEFRSRVFNFIDDGEFYLPENASVIHYRFAARMGRSDLGANKARAEAIRTAFTESLKQASE